MKFEKTTPKPVTPPAQYTLTLNEQERRFLRTLCYYRGEINAIVVERETDSRWRPEDVTDSTQEFEQFLKRLAVEVTGPLGYFTPAEDM